MPRPLPLYPTAGRRDGSRTVPKNGRLLEPLLPLLVPIDSKLLALHKK